MAEIEAPIVAVTVYTDRAQITRRGKAMLEASGVQELIVGGLPANLDGDSLRASGKGAIAVTIIGVESKERHFTETPHRNARELQDQLQELQDADKALQHQDETLGKRLDVVQQLADNAADRYARVLAAGSVPLEAAGQLLDFVSSQMNQVQGERETIEKRRRDNSRQRQALESQIKQLQSVKTRRDHYVNVLVEARTAGEWELELLYVVPGARWQPLYDARLTLGEGSAPAPGDANAPDAKLSLGYGASISQHTGEDWNDVAITLSTAQPSLGSLPPKLDPLYVDVYRPYPAAAPMMAGSAMAPRGMAARKRAGTDEDEELDLDMMVAQAEDIVAAPAQAVVETSGATVTFGLSHTLSVPSDGQPHRATIALRDFPCRIDYRAVPRRVEVGYLRATITNNSDLTLLPGEANIFRDGVYVGATPIETIAPGQEWKLFLGPDDQVRVKREMTRRDVEKNLIGNVRRQTYAYLIKVENLKNHRVPITVLDQIPVSRHEQIKVRLRHAEPAPITDDLGEMKWELTLPPGGKRELTYDYTVESPRDVTISGLND